KYNMATHIWMNHVEKDSAPGVWRLPSIPGPMLVGMYISKSEEKKMGVEGSATAEYRSDHGLPGSE
ncbi:hypothetical protein P691DRAFT_611512, partial [Macrolepiota fuliginosa MF-IS2]